MQIEALNYTVSISDLNESKKIDQITLNKLLSQKHSSQKTLYFANLLQENGFSTDITDLTIHIKKNITIDFSNCSFKGVHFSGDFQNSVFQNSLFQNCHFAKANLSYSTVSNTQFEHCVFQMSQFQNMQYRDTHFKEATVWEGDFSNSVFYNTNVQNSIFAKTNFNGITGTKNHSDGMQIIFKQGIEKDAQYAFHNVSFHDVMPSITILGDVEWHDTPHYIIKKYAASPNTLSEHSDDIDDTALALEVSKVIENVKTIGIQGISIAQDVLHSNQPLINSIVEKAKAIMETSDALWVPGGPDLHPEFYGQENTASYSPYSYYREILEFALTEAAIEKSKPILGVCHGLQLVNVYLGGTLLQDVQGHTGIAPILTILTEEGPMGSAIKGNLKGPSYHHQAVDKIASTLEMVAQYNNVLKAAQSTSGSPIMLTQFHPEYEADQNNINILNKFINFSYDSAIKKKTIQLSDILQKENDLIFESPMLLEEPIMVHSGTSESSTIYTATLPPILETLQVSSFLEV